MKLYRFTGPDTHKAMVKVNESLGPEALVYLTRTYKHGIEIFAGLPNEVTTLTTSKSVKINNSITDHELIESLTNQLQLMDDKIQRLNTDITTLYKSIADSKMKARLMRWNLIRGVTRIAKQLKAGVYGRQTV